MIQRIGNPDANERRKTGCCSGTGRVIHGAGGAIGGGVARAFAREGAKLFLAGRTLAELDAVARETSTKGGAAETAQVDALDRQSIEKHIVESTKKAGGIDVCFNTIGIQDVQGTPIKEAEDPAG